MRIFFPALIAALCCLIHLANARELTSLTTTSSLPKALSWLRGGARAKKATSSRVSKPSRYDDEDDEDDEDNFIRGRSKAKRSSSASKGSAKSSKGGKKRMEMVQWNDRGYNQKKKKKSKGFSIKEKLEQIAKTGTSAYKDIYRRAKVMRSSAFEGILLKATWPGNDPVPPELLTEIIKYSIPAFKYSRSDSEDDPYYMTMHKLWTKMSEKDWRTVTKSLFILHCISRDSSAEACNRFALAIKDMSKTRNPKKPDQKYFDLRHVSELDDNSAAFEPFVHAYGAYVIHRTKSFSSRFEELKDISSTTSEKKAIAALKKAQQAINLGLQCEVDKNERNVITGQAVKLVSNDMRELWKLYCEKVEPFVSGESSYADSKASKEDITNLIKFQKDKEEEIRSYLSKSSKAFSNLKIKIPSDLPAASISTDKLAARIEELTKINGGFVASDDDEDEEDEEEDEDEVADNDNEEEEAEDEEEDNEDGEEDNEEKNEAEGNDDEGDEGDESEEHEQGEDEDGNEIEDDNEEEEDVDDDASAEKDNEADGDDEDDEDEGDEEEENEEADDDEDEDDN